MNLYLLVQNENNHHQAYSFCVVCAANESEAKRIHPEEEEYYWVENKGWVWKSCPTWDSGWSMTWTHPKHVNVTLLGAATPETLPGVICKSLNNR